MLPRITICEKVTTSEDGNFVLASARILAIEGDISGYVFSWTGLTFVFIFFLLSLTLFLREQSCIVFFEGVEFF